MSKPKCGLCGSKKNLTKSECCNNWICNDEDNYVLFSYAHNSCFRNHHRYTLCFHHWNEGHEGLDWKTCEECKSSFNPEMYVYYSTNDYNFTKLENPPEYEPNRCANCNRVIKISEEPFFITGGKYYCCFGSSKKEQAQKQPQSLENVQQPRSKSVGSKATKKESTKLTTKENKAKKSTRSKSSVKSSGKKRSNTSKKAWVFVGEDKNNKQASTGTQKRERKKSSSKRNSSNSKSKDKKAPQYGKRKAAPTEADPGRSSSTVKAGKKVKKNEDQGSNKQIEINFNERADRSTSSRSGKGLTPTDQTKNSESIDVERSSSSGKGKAKKKVQGIKKKA